MSHPGYEKTMDDNLSSEEILNSQRKTGTLAIDLGNCTTIVAFQDELNRNIELLDLSPISRIPGEVPSLVWQNPKLNGSFLFGQEIQVLTSDLKRSPYLSSDFKRWIGSQKKQNLNDEKISAEKAGELLIKKIWDLIPDIYEIKRLVITAPIETYKPYRKWLYEIFGNFNVNEIALVDEPTAAAIGAGENGGAKLLVVDIGGSTIDMSMVQIEGGEGKAEPIAQLMRFNGKDLEYETKQVFRGAKVLGKAGLRLGGKDLDKWILNFLHPDLDSNDDLLFACEKLKCKLSSEDISDSTSLTEKITLVETDEIITLRLNRETFEELLCQRGLIKSLKSVLEKTLSRGRASGVELRELSGVIIVGGGSRIPLIRRWIQKEISPVPLLTPPPIEAVAVGALKLTPGTIIKDILHKGISIQCWDPRSLKHIWHPIFLAGQHWPTTKPFEIILGANQIKQRAIELKFALIEQELNHEIIYTNGIPTIQDSCSELKIEEFNNNYVTINLDPNGMPGEDCLKLMFTIAEDGTLFVEGIDLRTNKHISQITLGYIN